MTTLQVPSIILPQEWEVGTETENIADLVEHPSIEVPVSYLQEKQVHVFATEVVTAGTPGDLWIWVELSPVASATSPSYWAAIGGGGGALEPVSPTVEVATGVDGTVHTLILPWSTHSAYARIVVQTPVAASLPNAFWAIQVLVSAKSA